MDRPRVVIVGAGFAGLAAVQHLRNAAADVLIVDRHNYHLFQPLLYQVASALLDPSAIAYPVRAVVRKHHNADFLLAEVTGIDLDAKRLQTSAGEVSYDHLIVAPGARSNFFGISGLEERAFGMKSLDEALALRAQILEQFELANSTNDDEEKKRALTFCIAGGGPTGVELSGAFSEFIRLVLRREYPNLDFKMVDVVLVEARKNILEMFSPGLQRKAATALRRKGVRLLLGHTVKAVEENKVIFEDGSVLATDTVVWTAGVKAEALAASLTSKPGHSGRVPVDSHLRLAGHPEIRVVGDLAEFRQKNGETLPMLGGVAVQQGEYAGRQITAELAGTPDEKPFHYLDKGTMATIGRNAAIVQIGPLRYAGRLGWLTWLFVHLMLLVGFRNRIAAFISWAWDYIFYDRPVRLITGQSRSARGKNRS